MNGSGSITSIPKNIVICSDGTGNTAIKGRGTNVFKIFESVDIYGHATDPSLRRQVAIYDDGVGTSKVKPWRIFCGMFGWGLSRNVKELYAEVCRGYSPGDMIYLFGFSRGAFTVRTLAGLIVACGIIDREKCRDDEELKDKVKAAYSEYRRHYRTFLGEKLRKPVNRDHGLDFRMQHAVKHEEHAREGKVHIRFIGVWDTVDAVGLPFPGLAYLINRYIYCYKFPDHKLSEQVDMAYHALAIDDERKTFHPLLWDEEGEKGKRIEQVWFPGVHSNIGGGYPKQGLSLVSLYWMMQRASENDLRFSKYDWCLVREHQNPYDKLYDSRSGFARYYRYAPRNMKKLCEYNHVEPKIHLSAIERIVAGCGGYAPGNIAAASLALSEPQSHRGKSFSIDCGRVCPQSMKCDKNCNLAEIPPAIKGEVGSNAILLDKTRVWIFIRQACHVALISLTIAFILLTIVTLFHIKPNVSWNDIFKTVTGLFSGDYLKILELAGALPSKVLMPILVALVALACISWRARINMNRIYSTLWFKLHPDLERGLS